MSWLSETIHQQSDTLGLARISIRAIELKIVTKARVRDSRQRKTTLPTDLVRQAKKQVRKAACPMKSDFKFHRG